MKQHYFLKSFAINLGNIKRTLALETVLLEITEHEKNTLIELRNKSHEFSVYFFNEDIQVSFYEYENKNYLLVQELEDNSFHLDRMVIIPFHSFILRIDNNIF